jgi:hypothetical protein
MSTLYETVNNWFYANYPDGYNASFQPPNSQQQTPAQSSAPSPTTLLADASAPQPPIAQQAPAAFGVGPEQLAGATGPTLNTSGIPMPIALTFPTPPATVTASATNQVGPVLYPGVAPGMQTVTPETNVVQGLPQEMLAAAMAPGAGGASGRMSMPAFSNLSSFSSTTGRASMPSISGDLSLEISQAAGPGQSPLKQVQQNQYPPKDAKEWAKLLPVEERIRFAQEVGIDTVKVTVGKDKGKVLSVDKVSWSSRHKSPTLASDAVISFTGKIYFLYCNITDQIVNYFKTKAASGNGLFHHKIVKIKKCFVVLDL